MTLLEKLDAWSKIKIGDPIPPELTGVNNWGTAISNVLAEATAEIRRYQAWVDDLQSGMYVNCVYCGHRYGPGETTPVSMADALKAHVAVCPEHPMSGLVKAATIAIDALLNADPGNPEDETGWASDESRDAWVALRDALAKAGVTFP